MYKFKASRNGRFCVMHKDNSITIANENGEIYTRSLPFALFSILSVSNSGHIAAASENDIMIIPPSVSEPAMPVPFISKHELQNADSAITKIEMSAQGTYICAGISQKAMSPTDKIQAFFMIPGLKKHMTRNVISFINIETREKTEYFENLSPAADASKFKWAISSDFIWIAVAEPMKDGSIKLSSAKIKNSELFKEEILPPGSFIKQLKINVCGTIATEFEDEYGRHLKIIPINEESSKIEMKPGWQFIYLGNDFIAIKNDVPEIIIKTFDNYTKYYASFETLQEEEIPWSVQFFEKDNAGILTIEDGTLKVTRTSLNQLAIDAKTWTFIASKKAQEKNEEKEKQTLQEKKNEHFQKKREALALKLASFKKPEEVQEEEAPKQKSDAAQQPKRQYSAPLTLIPDTNIVKMKSYSENGEEINVSETPEDARARKLAAARRKIIT
ncbi:MAG: hypothetical protein MJ234_01355 [bacterium]|nr:hypothetical protein [bacterium]